MSVERWEPNPDFCRQCNAEARRIDAIERKAGRVALETILRLAKKEGLPLDIDQEWRDGILDAFAQEVFDHVDYDKLCAARKRQSAPGCAAGGCDPRFRS